jgi:hypothetical protein
MPPPRSDLVVLPPPPPAAPPPPPAGAAHPWSDGLLLRLRRPGTRRLGQLVGYYALLAAAGVVFLLLLPVLPHDIFPGRTLALPDGAGGLLGDEAARSTSVRMSLTGSLGRALATVVVTAGALLITLPVAWVYMYTKRRRYDPSLVQSVIILPIVVAGILLVVKDSLALAFSLAGVVAAVRFRNTLQDPKDTVYIFLAIGIGFAGGVGALDVALVLSAGFNAVVLLLWRYNVGDIYAGCHAPEPAPAGAPAPMTDAAAPPPPPRPLSVRVRTWGNRDLLPDRTAERRAEVVEQVFRDDEPHKRDGVLLVHVADLTRGKSVVEAVLTTESRRWRMADVSLDARGHHVLEYAVRTKKGVGGEGVLDALRRVSGSQVLAAEMMETENSNE